MVHNHTYGQATVEETKKNANKYFENEEYDLAYKLYSQLVSNFPKDVELNFRLGVCMIYSEPDKKKCLPYLQFAVSKPEAPKEAKFYYGKANHINYLFDEAIKYYNEYKKVGSNSQQKKLMVDREIMACGYGKRLLSSLSDLTVTSKKQLNEADYFRTYDLKSIGGKLLAKPEQLITTADKKKKDKSVIYKPKVGEKIFYSSFGPNNENGRDIYYSTLLPNGNFSAGVRLNTINTEYDEDYPFLHPNGKVLYFASKGHNSMGGYDIFKSEYNSENDTWSAPANLEFPINSPDDDFLYVTDSLEKTAYFSTGRQSPPGKIDVLKINTERKPIETLVIKGTVVKENKEQSLLSKITIKNMDNGQIVGEFKSSDNGDYLLDLPNGAKLIFTVETPELKTQSQGINLPLVQSSKPLKQKISYENGVLKIINYFEEAPTDDSYVQYLKLIEQKAKLDVNEGKNNLSLPDKPDISSNSGNTNNSANTNTTSETTNSGQTNSSASTNSNSVANNTNSTKTDNKQLSILAKKEAEESKKEAEQFSKDANDAFDLANAKKIEADAKDKEYEEAMKKADAITDENEKNKALGNDKLIKNEADALKNASEKINAYALALEDDSKVKAKETEINLKYANELDKLATGKSIDSKTSLKNLEDYQTELNKLSESKTKSDQIFNEIKNNIEEKEKQLVALESTNSTIKENLKEIENEIKTSEEELAKAKKKNKQEIQDRINELKDDANGKQKQINENEIKIADLKNELAQDKNPLALATRVNNETISNKEPIKINEPINNSSNSINTNKNVVIAESIALTYKDKTEIKNPNDKNNINESTSQLKNFNKEIDAAIAKNKTEYSKTKIESDKNEIASQIKLLENLKKENNQKIIDNNKLALALNNANSTQVTNNKTGNQTKNNSGNTTNSENSDYNSNKVNSANKNNELTKVSASNSNDAINQLNKLQAGLDNYNNQNFNFNSYENENAQKLKVEADALINESVAKQKTLKDDVTNTIKNLSESTSNVNNTINNQTTSNAGGSYKNLIKEADDLNNQALDKMEKANSANGTEKETLRNEAVELTNKATEKSLQAALALKSENEYKFNANKKNIETFINSDKTPEPDKNFANALLSQAVSDYNKAKAMREEAMSLPNAAAKVGALTNAEEKENEALQKLNNAIETIKKSNPSAAFINTIPDQSNATASNVNSGNTSSGNLSEAGTAKLSEVNKELENLVALKTSAYQKLFQANQAELDQLNGELQNNQNVSNTPANKTELIKANTLVSNAIEQLQQANTSGGINQLNLLQDATSKQIEAINRLNKLKNKVNTTSVVTNNGNTSKNNTTNQNANGNTSNITNNKNGTSENTNGNNTGGNNNNGTAKNTNGNNTSSNNINGTAKNTNGNNTSANNTNGNAKSANSNNTTVTNNNGTTNNANVNNTAVINNNGTAKNTAGTNNNGTVSNTNGNNTINPNSNNPTAVSNVPIINKNTFNTPDTNAKQTNDYVNSNKVDAQNPQAKAMIDQSIADLNTTFNSGGGSEMTTTELKTKIDEINSKADDLALKAFDTKSEANSKSGDEKEQLLKKSKQFEDEANTEKIKALELSKLYNQNSITANSGALEELIAKLKTDNPTLAEETNTKLTELGNLNNQINALQKEADQTDNTAVKVGKLNNVAEKEAELITKQNTIIEELKKTYPDYVVKTNKVNVTSNAGSSSNTSEESIEKQNTALTNLINGYSLEYETSKNSLPANLNESQSAAKQNANQLNQEAKELLIKSSQTNDTKQKNKLLAQAAKTNNAALNQLKLISKTGTTSVASTSNTNKNNTAKNNTANTTNNNSGTSNNVRNNNGVNTTSNNTGNPNTIRNSTGTNSNANNSGNTNSNPTLATNNTNGNIQNAGRNTIKVEGLEVINGNAYNNSRPIPMDAKIPDGLVFRVQIGAFKTALPNNAFRGLSPVNGETVGNGYIRYTAGSFTKFENASAVKNDLRNLGYSDAFVVVYYNGKRIALNEALAILEREGKSIDNTAPSTAGITANTNIPRASVVFPNSPNTAPTPPNEQVKVTKEIETIRNLFYTVQIGVYSKQVRKSQLGNLTPIYTEKLANGLFRYTAGIYNNGDKIITDKRRVNELGIRDAFVSAYLNGKRVDFNDYKNRQKADSTIIMEQENPIVFPEGTPLIAVANNNAVPTLTIEPFKNNVTNYPEATPENGIKATQDGICFKVQIGAYSRQVPNDVASKFLSIQNWPIENKQINALYIYNVGNFINAKSATKLRDEVIKLGILDAFITVYKDGTKIYNKDEIQKLMSAE
jgi:hypothetical protein